jgi:DNA polymerase V
MYALVDCNNFYCSCELLFNPSMAGRPIVVLSNNDGCAIARNEQARKIGIDMGTPAFMLQDLIVRHRVVVFSSNYTLYGDMSDRVMKTLGSFSPSIEIYSIDEAFLDCHSIPEDQLHEFATTVKKTVTRNTGIPVSIGIARTKTLAKMANRFAKKHMNGDGVFVANDVRSLTSMLNNTDVSNIWGIGHQYALFLKRNGFHTAADLASAPEPWVRANLTVIGQRLLNELRGIPCIAWMPGTVPRKNICTSRSFGKLLSEKQDIAEAIANYAANCALKLRSQRSSCRTVHVFIQTNPHKQNHQQYMRSIDVQMDVPSNNSPDIIRHALKGFDIIFKPGYLYMKCGVVVMDLVSEDAVQANAFVDGDRNRKAVMMKTVDAVNRLMGKETVRLAVQGFDRKYRLKAEHLSKRYTTRMDEVLKVNIDAAALFHI